MPQPIRNEIAVNQQFLGSRQLATQRRRAVRILFVNEKRAGVQLCLNELKRMDFSVSSDRVQTAADFQEQLRTKSYDVIVCEYSMPNWTGLEALQFLQQSKQD